MANEDNYMNRCLQLARLGAGYVAPNPLVGAILVYKDEIIGEGYHQCFGKAHAEVNCINSVAKHHQPFIQKSTLYVSLEPCNHFGKTPPCTDLIIKNKIPKVVIACGDSFETVNGRGIQKLKSAGIQVITGVLEKEALQLNKRFFTFHQHKRPYIILKWAQSNNGKIAGNGPERVFITNEITNRLVHQWRTQEAAILVGTNTALKDNPELKARWYPGKNPVRLVIDLQLKLPGSLHLFDGTVQTMVFNLLKTGISNNVSYHKINENEKILPQVLELLYKLQIQSVLVEGGAKLLQSFVDENLWDEAIIVTNTGLNISKGINAPELNNTIKTATKNIQSDKIEYFANNYIT